MLLGTYNLSEVKWVCLYIINIPVNCARNIQLLQILWWWKTFVIYGVD